MKRTSGQIITAMLVTLVLASCAPQTATQGAVTTTLNSPEAVATNRVAKAAWHRMQSYYLETGQYTTNALVDLELPQGVRWTIESFSADGYVLTVTSSAVPEVVWVITPEGVTAKQRTVGASPA